MNKLRYSIFMRKVNPKIKNLPPTGPALHAHNKRAHLQTMLWKAVDKTKPPVVEIENFGWQISSAGQPKPCPGIHAVDGRTGDGSVHVPAALVRHALSSNRKYELSPIV